MGEERYKTIYNTLHDGVVQYDLKGNIISANPAAARLTGYTQAELLTMKRSDVIAPAPSISDFRARLIAGEQMPPQDRTLLHKDGSFIPIERAVALMRDGNGNPEGNLTVWRDLREQREAELALKENEERYRAVYRHLREAVL